MILDMEADTRAKKIVPALQDLRTRLGKGDKIRGKQNNNAQQLERGLPSKMFQGGINTQVYSIGTDVSSTWSDGNSFISSWDSAGTQAPGDAQVNIYIHIHVQMFRVRTFVTDRCALRSVLPNSHREEMSRS